MNLLRIDKKIVDERIEIPAGETGIMNLVTFDTGSPCKIEIKLNRGSLFNMAFADLGNWEGTLQVDVDLAEEGAEFVFHCASVSSVNEKKRVEVNVTHNAPRTKSLVSSYGIAADNSQIRFEGCSHIVKGAVGSSTRQEAKAILFDPLSQGFCSPVLKIDENDIEASHAASVGKVNEDHLFYLRSRGLTLEEARRLIVLGYLKPITAYFFDESIKERIVESVEKVV